MKKTVILFGGSGGLGKKLTPLLKEKYNVIATSSKEVDVTSVESVKNFLSEIDYDVIINLSGYNYDSFIHKINDYSEVDKMIDVNIKGNINLLSQALPKLRGKQYGRIILISSVLSKKTVAGTSLYSGSKAFIDNFVKTTSAENISKGITCNSIQLGYFDGGMCHRLPDNFANKVKESIGLKRWGKIEELYQTIEYLINTEYITGQNINISGGLL